MPINSNGSSLKVETIVGDTTFKNESYRDVAYGRNQQNQPQRELGTAPGDTKAFGRHKPKLSEQDKKLLKANQKDLTKKNIK